MAWKPLWQTYMCSSLYGALIGIKEPSTAPFTLGIRANLKKSAIISCQARTKFVCIEFQATSSLFVSSRIPAKFKAHHSLCLQNATPKNSPLLPKFQKVTHVVCCNENIMYSLILFRTREIYVLESSVIKQLHRNLVKFWKPFYTLTISYSSLASKGTYIQLGISGWKHYPFCSHFYKALRDCQQGSARTCLWHSHNLCRQLLFGNSPMHSIGEL